MITVNGKEVTLTGPLSVADYLEQNNYQIKRIAVEMNGDILPKYSYSDTMLKDGVFRDGRAIRTRQESARADAFARVWRPNSI